MMTALRLLLLLIASLLPSLGVAAIAVGFNTPIRGTVFTAPADITLNATAFSDGGSIVRVEFYQGSTLIGLGQAGVGYTFDWANVPIGDYTLTAKAIDSVGATQLSGPVSISVRSQPNSVPAISVTEPSDGASYAAPASIQLSAYATDSDGSVAKVEFYNGTTLLGTVTTNPWNMYGYYGWTNVPIGTYTITAKAYDNLGAVTASNAVNITVKANQAPTVSLTAPANGASYALPATVNLTATASDSDGRITKVEFYDGTTLLAADTSGPYGYTWANPGAGSHSLTAKAYDDVGGTRVSAPVGISVASTNAPPTVSLTSPTAGSSYTAPASIPLTANAIDSDGSIAKVEFYNGTTLLGTVTASPYSYTWGNVAAGSYTVTAKAYDNLGASADSASMNLTVTASLAHGVYYIYADQLNAPRVITDTADRVVWRWDSEPFGSDMANEDPSNLGTFQYNLRFPGQYYDKETGLHYNYQRDGYDAATGRYTQSDPLGLFGGSLSTYGYANQNPLSFTDPTGEAAQLAWCFGGPVPCVVAVGGTIVVGGMMSQSMQNSRTGATSTSTSSSQEQCCTEFKKIYDPGDPNRPKHGASGYWGSNGNWVSPAPINGQAALNNSVTVGGRNRVGFDPISGQVVEFRLTRRDEVNCIEYWHGFVVNNQPVPMDPSVRNAARNAGFPIPKK